MRAETGSLLDMPKPMDGFTVDLHSGSERAATGSTPQPRHCATSPVCTDAQMGSVDMADWKTDSELYEIADQLANKIMQMYTAAGVFIPVGQKRDAVLESVRLDAETYMSLDPQKIVDEFQRMQRASKDTGEAAVATSLLRAANIKISSTWRGDMASVGTHGDRRATCVEAAAPFSRHV